MTALHYATYFDVAPVLTILLHKTKGADVDTHCVEYENGTALHIAASNLSLAAARVLLKFGANSEAVDDLGRKPRECVPEPETFDMVPDAQDLIDKMVKLLSEGLESRSVPAGSLARTSTESISGRTVMGAMGLKLSDRVVVWAVRCEIKILKSTSIRKIRGGHCTGRSGILFVKLEY